MTTTFDSSQRTICLSDLPSGALSHAATFLAVPSRALFAGALNSAIAYDSPLEALDFGDIEKELAVKLSDKDIKDALISIDATNRLKLLRLTNCINITGAGLEPLRGSTVIENIDLSLVGRRKDYYLRPKLSCDKVLSILDSIIERPQCT